METTIFQLNNVYLEKKQKTGITQILSDINFSVNDGEFVCVMGPTGCGKSSLMRLLGSTETPSSGSVLFFGKNTNAEKAIDKNILRQVGTAFQSDNLSEWKTVEKNMQLPIDIFGLKNMLDVSSQTEKMLKLTGLVNYKNCYPRELSGGMRQRCAFGRALIHNPKILLLDQPFGALDAITRKILGIELLKIWKEQKKTIVMITNSVPEALMLGQRILVMSSAPGNITHEVINHIPYEKRFEDLGDNEKYKLLAEKLNTYVHEKKRYS